MDKLAVSFIDFTWDAMPLKKSVMERAHLGYEPDVRGELLSGQYTNETVFNIYFIEKGSVNVYVSGSFS